MVERPPGPVAAQLEPLRLSRVLEDERRWEEIEASLGAIDDRGHKWDRDPAAWVRAGRRADAGRVG